MSNPLQQTIEALAKEKGIEPDVVISANPGCMLQIAAGLRDIGANARVVHLARFLDDPESAVR